MTPLNQPELEEFAALRKVSAEIGADPMLVQSAGGNTSIKDGDVMWIKASGTLLADAEDKDIFVPVDLLKMRRSMLAGEARADQPAEFLLPGGLDLRPSIETSLHAVFSQKIVLHAHCIHTIVHAVQVEREELLATTLAGLNWALVQYVKPGATLANLVIQRLDGKTNVVVLGNHGVIVAGDSVEQAHALLIEVHKRLAIDSQPEVAPDLTSLEELAQSSEYVLPEYLMLHQLALDPVRVKQATSGSLYPDHVIFCGIGATALADDESPIQAKTRVLKTGAPAPVFLIVPEQGVLVRRDASSGAHALMRCLVDVLLRLPVDAELCYLTHEQNLELLDWDAEKYRKALNAE
ncbi:MAG: class II aldolase/adducin family protein [Rhizobiaceae bacterium]